MSVYANNDSTFHRATCGRDGEPCPTGEHGWCPGCRSSREVLVTAPATQHDDGCPVVTEPTFAASTLRTEPTGRPFDTGWRVACLLDLTPATDAA